MSTPWDRAAPGYLETWVPRFTPYHVDLVRELALEVGDRVLVVSAGPGAEALAAARVVDLEGHVRATDTSEAMVRLCRERMALAGFTDPAQVRCEVADATDTTGRPWDAVMCAFGLWQLDGEPDASGTSPRDAALRAWQESLSDSGKVGLLVWGPPEPDDAFESLSRTLHALEPMLGAASPREIAAMGRMSALVERAGLVVMHHEILRHPCAFSSAESFVSAVRESCVLRSVWEQIGDERMQRVADAFYVSAGGPRAPVSFAPAATLVIAARPGAVIELPHHPSVRVPKA